MYFNGAPILHLCPCQSDEFQNTTSYQACLVFDELAVYLMTIVAIISVTGDDGQSGFGFELSFRLKRDAADSAPPTWPAELMQNLARYVFHSGNHHHHSFPLHQNLISYPL